MGCPHLAGIGAVESKRNMFSYVVHNQSSLTSDQGIVYLNIDGVDDLPYVKSKEFHIYEDQVFSFNLKCKDNDTDKDLLIVEIVDAPQHAYLFDMISSNLEYKKKYQYVPIPNFSGADQ